MAGTEMGEVGAPGGATLAQRWLARLALVAATAAVLVAPVVAGLGQSLALVLVGLAGLAGTAAGVWWALTNKGLVRGLAVALAVAAPLGVLVLSTGARLTWVVLVAFGLLALGVAAGRAALGRDAIPERMQDPDRIWPGLGGGPATLRRSPSEAVRLQERSARDMFNPILGRWRLA